MKLFHYSKSPHLTELDPKMFGQNKSISPEYKQGTAHMVPRTYFYTEDKPESLVESGRFRYESDLPKEAKVYDLGEDPENIIDTTHKATRLVGPGLFDKVEEHLKNKGYFAYKNSKSTLPHVMAVFHPMKVKAASNEKIEKAEKQIDKKFKNAHELNEYLHNGSFALITPHHSARSDEENKKAHKSFLKDLNELGHQFTPMIGQWGGQTEPSYMVHDIPEHEAAHIAKKYGQLAHIQSHKGIHKDYSHHGDYKAMLPGKGHEMGDHFADNYSTMQTEEGPANFRVNLDNMIDEMPERMKKGELFDFNSKKKIKTPKKPIHLTVEQLHHIDSRVDEISKMLDDPHLFPHEMLNLEDELDGHITTLKESHLNALNTEGQ